jgi:restriction system protein
VTEKNENRFVRMYGPLLDALRDAGGEGSPREIQRTVADAVLGGTEERNRELKSGGNAAENEVAWARNNLREAGLIDGSTRGIWRLTAKGWETHLTLSAAKQLGRHAKIKMNQLVDQQPDLVLETPAPTEPELPKAKTLLETIQSLPPKGFERLCQRILRELGFAEVTVTGRSGDGGIDGDGVLMVNELVSFRVLFQCKRYVGSVSSTELTNFRGAMSGRTDKGIFLTTGHFTSNAQKEAIREGVPPVELVDGERLVALMEKRLLGVKPRTVYDIDEAFFAPFLSES